LDRDLLAHRLHHSCQTRTFLFIDECLEGVRRLVDATFAGPVNIGSDEMVTIYQLAAMIMEAAGRKLTVRHILGPLGVRGRNSDNCFMRHKPGWAPSRLLHGELQTRYR
jgi:GDP-D-mannose 3', 5'-epimerase